MAIDWSKLIGSASPLSSGGIDPDQWIANGGKDDDQGVSYQAKPGEKRTTLGPTSALPPKPYATGVSRPPDDGNVRSTSSPAGNAPNPPSEAPIGGAVPSTVSPSGGSRFSEMRRQALLSKGQILGGASQNPAVDRMLGLESQRAALESPASASNPTGIPNAQDAQYKPSLGRRIARGVEGVGLGLAEGGVRGALAGGIAPQTTGLAGYRDPNSAFFRAQQANKEATENIGQQLSAEQEQEKLRNEGQKTTNETAAQYGTLADQADKVDKGPSVDEQYSAAVKSALDKGIDPSQDKTVQQLADAKTSIQKTTAPKEASREDKAVAIYAKDPKNRTADENSFIAGYEHDIKVSKTDPGVSRMSVLLQMPQAVADPDTPGGVKFTTRKGAIGQQAPSSSTVRVPAKVLQDFTSGADAKTVTRLNTSYDHLNRLAQVSDALKNNDTRIINELANKWATETGQPAPTNFDAVKAAVAGEVAGTFKGSGATDEEIAQITATINSKNSPAELRGVINEYRGLIGSKRDELKHQFDQGVKGQPGFGSNNTTSAPTPDTHIFNSASYAAKHPGADMKAVTAEAKRQGFTVK